MKAVEVIVTDKNGKTIYKTGYNLDLYEEYIKRNTNDLTTLWLRRFYISLFTPLVRSQGVTFTFTDTTGTVRTQDLKVNIGATPLFLNTYACSNRFWISYGSSSTTPSPTDYRLGNKIDEGVATATVSETTGIMTFSVSFTISNDITIYEVGLEWEATVAGTATCGRFLVDRTVFPEGITVLAGQVLTIIYRFVL